MTTSTLHHHSHDHNPEAGVCAGSEELLVDILAPYLYPLVIEFALIAAAILYKIFSNIGKLDRAHNSGGTENEEGFQLGNHAECHKANTGIFLGLFVLAINIMMTIIYLWSDDENVKQWVYVISDISNESMALIATILALAFTTRLNFVGEIENRLDIVLLLLTISGTYFITITSMIPEVFYTSDLDYVWIWMLELGLNFIQATLQIIFIIDGSQREAATRWQRYHKPGRSFVSFLLFTNLSMWLINSFEMKEALVLDIMVEFYGSIAWTIMLYISLPLSVFFRFHSVVCLADIWSESYSKREFLGHKEHGQKVLKGPVSKLANSSRNSWQSGTYSNMNGQEIRVRKLNGNNNNNSNIQEDGPTADKDISVITSI